MSNKSVGDNLQDTCYKSSCLFTICDGKKNFHDLIDIKQECKCFKLVMHRFQVLMANHKTGPINELRQIINAMCYVHSVSFTNMNYVISLVIQVLVWYVTFARNYFLQLEWTTNLFRHLASQPTYFCTSCLMSDKIMIAHCLALE